MTFRVLDMLDSPQGQIIISIILGVGLAALFQKVCKDGTCVIVQGPPLEEVENKIFKKEDKCYRYKAETAKCEDHTASKTATNTSTTAKQ